ncbi:MAG: BlaI/MecI/CopY family transcriptional regulator [Planctomycetaceae bacterium]|nr:BlaI/MecI/CopY family transcriptional regulator [Planctomycetaceae bacterium]
MKRKKTQPVKLAPGEMELLELLWSEKQVTLAKTQEWFHKRGRPLAPTTLHTRLNRLVDKGFIRRVAENPAVYEAAIDRKQVSGRYFELFEELCGRNLVPFMAHLAANRDFSPEELAYLEKLVAEKGGIHHEGTKKHEKSE